jgi:exocyst complex component 4
MGVALQPWKLRYIFEGVGHLVATILINCANTIKRINSNGVKKMCRNIFAIQQSLTSITMSREVALDYARQYFELFYHTPEEILTTIVEKGPQFQLNEYISAITLLHKSIAGREQQLLDSVLKRLTEILNEVAVSL